MSSLGHTHPQVREATKVKHFKAHDAVLLQLATVTGQVSNDVLTTFPVSQGARALQPPACKKIRDMDKCCRHQ